MIFFAASETTSMKMSYMALPMAAGELLQDACDACRSEHRSRGLCNDVRQAIGKESAFVFGELDYFVILHTVICKANA